MFPPPFVLCVWCWLCLTPLMSLPPLFSPPFSPPFSLSNSHTKVRPSFPRFSHSYWYSWYNRRGEVGWVRVEGWHRSEWDVSLKNIWHQRSLLRWSGISNGPHSPHSQELLLDSFVTPGGNSEVSDHERRRRRKKSTRIQLKLLWCKGMEVDFFTRIRRIQILSVRAVTSEFSSD